MRARNCTCAGIAPGWPQHEWFCGMPEPSEDCTCGHSWIDADCTEHGHLIVEAEALDERVAS